MTLTDLPLECLAHALRFLPAADVSRAMASCATLRDVGGSETMWRWLSWRDFGIVPPPGPLRADPARGAALGGGVSRGRALAPPVRARPPRVVRSARPDALVASSRCPIGAIRGFRCGRPPRRDRDAPTVPRRQIRDADAERGPGSSAAAPCSARSVCTATAAWTRTTLDTAPPPSSTPTTPALLLLRRLRERPPVACFVEGDVAEAHAREERRMDRRAYMTERCRSSRA